MNPLPQAITYSVFTQLVVEALFAHSSCENEVDISVPTTIQLV